MTLPSYRDFKTSLKYDTVQAIRSSEVKWLWINDFFDGPLQGIVEFNSRYCLSCFVEEAEDHVKQDWYRRYVVIELTDEQITTEKYWHDEFLQHVGDHFNCNPDSSRIKVGATMPKNEWKKFYDPYKEEYHPDFENNPVLGWFQL